ncbi:MAG: hypothetical protein JXB07_05700 [Anaerolineae bacterium]|nr:hypothetical protein [Anaerolineae bacterium]
MFSSSKIKTRLGILVGAVAISVIVGILAIPRQSANAASFLDWSYWYPVDRGQPVGRRVINRWDHPYSREITGTAPLTSWWRYHGQATWNVPGAPETLPTTYNSQNVDYFVNWQCGAASDDNQCLKYWTTYREYISEGRVSGADIDLQHWARGSEHNWEVYYNPSTITNCTSSGVKSVGNNIVKSTSSKSPLVMRLPTQAGTTYRSPMVCTVAYDQYIQDVNHTIDQRNLSMSAQRELYKKGELALWQTGNWIVETKTLSKSGNLVQAENRYYSNNPSQGNFFSFDYCEKRNPYQNPPPWFTADSEHCNGKTRKTKTFDGKTYYLFAFETYWMRQVEPSNRLTNGMGSYHWSSWGLTELQNLIQHPDWFNAWDDDVVQEWTAPEACHMENGMLRCP